MKLEIHPHWASAVQQAEQDLKYNLPSVYALRQANPQHKWSQHRSLQVTELSRWCLANQPKVILELGSGWTTFVLARYAAEFRAIRFASVEEDEKWRDAVAKLIPDWANIEWHVCPRVVENETVRYQSLPDLAEIDLLYVDGPNGDYCGKSLTCVDAIRLIESGVKVNNVLFDIRNKSALEFRNKVSGYGWEPGASVELDCPAYLRPFRHHSWFWRKA